jgi:AraC-like DNA-binding protein
VFDFYLIALAEQLYVSPKYLSSLLRVLTGRSAQQHIHEKLIAKEELSTSDRPVTEIAYALFRQSFKSNQTN